MGGARSNIGALLLIGLFASSAWAHDDTIRVEMRPVPGSDLKEAHGWAIIAAPLERVLDVLRSVEGYPALMPLTKVAQLIGRQGDTAWYYMVIEPPIIARRDYCIKMTISHFPDGSARSAWEMAPERCPPPVKGVLRLQQNRGSWDLSPTPDRTACWVHYTGYTEPGGHIPAWIVNRVTEHEIKGAFTAVRRALMLPQGH
jgi:hypothetical protein